MTHEQLAAMAKHFFYVFPKLVSGAKIPKHIKFIGEEVQKAIEKKSDKNRMLIISIPPRHGKTISENSLISMSSGMMKFVKDIKEGEYVSTINDDYKISKNKVLKKVKSAKKQVCKITLSNGQEIKSSDEHRYIAFNKGWLQLKDLTLDDYIAVEWPDIKKYNNTINVDDAILLGVWYADGHKNNCSTLYISNSNNDIYKQIKIICDNKIWNLEKYFDENNNVDLRITQIDKNNIPIIYLRSIIDTNVSTYNFRIPRCIWESDNSITSNFIKAFFSCDGHFNKHAGTIELILANKNFLLDMQLLLRRFRIRSKISYKKCKYQNGVKDGWRLTISDKKSIIIYCNEIGSISKKEQLDNVKKLTLGRGISNSKTNVLPAIWKKLLKNTDSWFRFKHNIRIDKNNNTHIDKIRKCALIENNKYLINLIDNDVEWVKISKIEYLNKYEEMYDLYIENNHNFIANGIIVHNSFLISKHLPAWYLGKYPRNRVILTSYSSELSDQHSDYAKNIFAKWGPSLFDVKPSKTTFNRSSWDNEFNGGCISAGVGGSITGFGASCVFPDTLIKTITCDIKISELKVGDKVLSYNNDKLCYNKVLAIKKRKTKEIYEITIGENKIKATGNHRFFICGQGYVKAENLQEGFRTLTIKQDMQIKEEPISRIRKVNISEQLVYDIQVENASNFFANNVLVHNCLIIDDYCKGYEEAESKSQKEKLWNWWQSVASSRLHPNSVVIVICTMWASDDLSGRLIQQYKEEGDEFPFDFKHINLPAIAEEDDPLGRKPGEALWPERFSAKMLMNVKKTAGPFVWAALWQGNPRARGGNLFKSMYFRYWTLDWITNSYVCHLPDQEPMIIPSKDLRRIVIVDPALEIKTRNDPSGMLAWGYSKKYKVWLLLDALKGKIKHEILHDTILNFAFRNKCSEIFVENEKIGKILIKQSSGRDKMNGVSIPFKEVKTKNKDKFSRCIPMASYTENGRVFFKKDAPWLEEYESDLTVFPDSDDDCWADCTGHASILEKSISVAEALARAMKLK